MSNRYLPSGVLDENLNLSEPDEKAIAEWVGRSWYKGSETYQAPNFTNEPEYTDYNVNDPLHVGEVPDVQRQLHGGYQPVPCPGRLQAQRALHQGAC